MADDTGVRAGGGGGARCWLLLMVDAVKVCVGVCVRVRVHVGRVLCLL